MRKLIESVNRYQFYYHVTPTDNVESITQNGLVPQSGPRSQQMGDHGIYLFRDIETANDAIMNWLGDEFDDESLTMFRVLIPMDARVTEEAFEVVVHDPIPPTYIEEIGEVD